MSKSGEKSVEEPKRKYSSTVFPKNTLKDALRIAQSIQDNNAGRPYNRLDVAQAVGYSPESSGFRTLIISSGRYGLTEGGYAADKLSLTEIGRSIVAPRDDEERKEGLLKALKNIEFFRKFFERYDQSKMPRDDLLKNALTRDFGIPPEDVDSCLNILRQNLTDWGLLADFKGNIWLRLDKLAKSEEKVGEVPLEGAVEEITEGNPIDKPIEETKPICKSFVPNAFISHSKNDTILEQIKTILEFGQFKYTVAEEVETTSIPIPEKVFTLMRNCNCAIINVSADEKEKNLDNSYRVNPNVLIEIGAAFLAYNRKVILLADKRVTLPTNLQGLYRCEYEGNELSFSAALKLQKALVQFRETI
jgi:hypothetical protein